MHKSSHKDNLVRFANQRTRVAAAVPSLLAESLARAALTSKTDEPATALENVLNQWSGQTVLFNMTLDDEIAFRSKSKLEHCEDTPINELLSKRALNMRPVITNWEPKRTAVHISTEGVAVIYKDHNGGNLMRVIIDMRRLDDSICLEVFLCLLLLLLLPSGIWYAFQSSELGRI